MSKTHSGNCMKGLECRSKAGIADANFCQKPRTYWVSLKIDNPHNYALKVKYTFGGKVQVLDIKPRTMANLKFSSLSNHKIFFKCYKPDGSIVKMNGGGSLWVVPTENVKLVDVETGKAAVYWVSVQIDNPHNYALKVKYMFGGKQEVLDVKANTVASLKFTSFSNSKITFKCYKLDGSLVKLNGGASVSVTPTQKLTLFKIGTGKAAVYWASVKISNFHNYDINVKYMFNGKLQTQLVKAHTIYTLKFSSGSNAKMVFTCYKLDGSVVKANGGNSVTVSPKEKLEVVEIKTDVNPCEGVSCKNGGSCKASGNSYTCACKKGYIGKHCETAEIKECKINGGSCKCNSVTGKKTDCKCHSDFMLVDGMCVSLIGKKDAPAVEATKDVPAEEAPKEASAPEASKDAAAPVLSEEDTVDTV